MLNAKKLIDEAVAGVSESANPFLKDLSFAIDKFGGYVSSVVDVGSSREYEIDFDNETDLKMFLSYMKGKAKLSVNRTTATVAVPLNKVAKFTDYDLELNLKDFISRISVHAGRNEVSAQSLVYYDREDYDSNPMVLFPESELTNDQKKTIDSFVSSGALHITLDTKGKLSIKI